MADGGFLELGLPGQAFDFRKTDQLTKKEIG